MGSILPLTGDASTILFTAGHVVGTPYESPWQHPYVERMVGTLAAPRGVQELIHSPECPQSSFTGPLTYIVEQLKRRPMWRPGTGQVTMTGCVGATAMT